MGTQPTESHNPAVRSSGKAGNNRFAMTEAKAAACRVAKALCLPLTFRNLYVIELAIEAEIEFSATPHTSSAGVDVPGAEVPVAQVTAEIIGQAQAARRLGVSINYLWFEDCGWRFHKFTFQERDEMRMRERARHY